MGSPWYTLCEVRSPDRRGLLHTITVGSRGYGRRRALGAARDDGRLAVDRFELTDRNDRKLDADTKAAIIEAITGGVVASKRRLLARRR